MPDPQPDCDLTRAILAESLAKAQRELRAQCETEGLLSTYEEVHECYLGEGDYIGFSLGDWIRLAEFQYGYMKTSREYYRVSRVVAYLISAKAAIDRGKFDSAKEMLRSAEMSRHDLKGELPSLYVDPSIADQRPSKRGGLVKHMNRKFNAVLSCLEDNHKLDGKDFKSFDEAVEYGVAMWIAEGQSDGVDKLQQLKGSLPRLFRDWLRLNPDAAAKFKVFTGIAWDD